jgi:lysozyme
VIERLAAFFTLAKHFEGCHLTPYYCPAGVLTCGWGSTGPDVFPGKPWSQEYADMRLGQDAIRFAAGTLAACPGLAQESDARLSAITDFAYNLGLGRLRASTLRIRINAGQWDKAGTELRRWVYGGGRKLRGLVLRRKAEAALLSLPG